jgi:cytoskeletal protein CcmA (bactofilin family)
LIIGPALQITGGIRIRFFGVAIMFGSKQGETATQRPRNSGSLSFIGAEVVISGNVNAAGDIHLDGAIEGDLSCTTLILGPSGRVTGHVTAEKATLAGTIDGTVTARDLALERTAMITGDLAYENVSIETGAKVDGRVSHRPTMDSSTLKLVEVAAE